MYAAMLLAAATPEPSAPPPELVTPGPWGFAAIAFVAAAVFLLVWDMLRRIRRGRYREEINEELDAAEAQARAAEEASDVDDQDIDPRDDGSSGTHSRDGDPDRR
jgi:flagellar biosynthesis/type III secretory pathway M-ring protein FliF/YscJ